jgi:hypothetical protein
MARSRARQRYRAATAAWSRATRKCRQRHQRRLSKLFTVEPIRRELFAFERRAKTAVSQRWCLFGHKKPGSPLIVRRGIRFRLIK